MAQVRFKVDVPETLDYTPREAIEDSITLVRGLFTAGWRTTAHLKRLYSMVKDHEDKFYEALAMDMKKPRHEALMGEISPVLDECLYFLDNIERLAKDETVKARSVVNRADTCVIRKDPLGVVLIIGAWNYPLQLVLVPLAGAIAAGNAAIIKPSEVSVHTSALITELFPKYMDTSCYRIVNGGVEETTALLQYQFDHIFYTGNNAVAKIVMAAAAKHLTPVTLELGGKSPAIITEDAKIDIVAKRIAFGKFFNAGQSCVAVDYVLIPNALVDRFVQAVTKVVKERFGEDPKLSKDFGRIVSLRHFDRIANMINNRASGTIVLGGDTDREERYIAPTVISNVSFHDDVLMGDEIFGPVLPIIAYSKLEDAVAMVKKKSPPLVAYVFSNKSSDQEKVIKYMPSGGVCMNDCLMHFAEFALPFGGVGSSGMGKYHGDRSFQAFTHERSILIKKQRLEFLNRSRYPPYTVSTYKTLRYALIAGNLTVRRIVYKRGIRRFIVFLVLYLLLRFRRRLAAALYN
ncbi:hypothetical protein VTP01DRAFT_864 [Rhizomucor pusillus]|uniref:uncharacterized protein n=1 Tax=Rhizomucor pusillus TaxID=4840 RepID=UPI003743DD9E